jgi:glycogen debranching enzyme
VSPLAAMSKLVLMDEATFAVTDESGEIGGIDPADGLYHDDMRHLSEYRLALNGEPLDFLAAPPSDSASQVVVLTNRRLTLPNRDQVLPQTISLRRTRLLSDGLHERLELVSYNQQPIPFELEITFGADFRDMFDIRGIARTEQSTLPRPHVEDGALVLAYEGRDGICRETVVRSEPAFSRVHWSHLRAGPAAGDGVSLPDAGHVVDAPMRQVERAHGTIEGVLEPHTPVVITLSVEPRSATSAPQASPLPLGEGQGEGVTPDPAPAPASNRHASGLARGEAGLRKWREQATTRIDCSYQPLGRLLDRSAHDLFLLTRRMPTGLVPVAGIPWFACPFGRDSILTSLATLTLAPELAVGTLRFLAAHQGTVRDDRRDEEPGKIMHELRAGELANLGLIPQTPYYGSVDATPLFLVLLAETVAWLDDDDGLLEELWASAERALGWIDQCGDLDGDGLVEYLCRSPIGIRNQGWKDSDDSVTHADGRIAEPPIALIEVQAYCYAARCAMAGLYRRRGDAAGAARLAAEAERFAALVRERFWLAELGCFAEALDRDKRPVAVVTSNAAHALYGGLATPEQAERTAARLLEPDMLSGWGLRTLSSRAPSFNPMSYHNGSVWPHDNAIAVAGLARYGQSAAAHALFEQVCRAAMGFRSQRLPELYCGFQRGDEALHVPAAYPVSCSPQAWAAAAPYMMLHALLGLEPSDSGLRLRPSLPAWLDWVQVENLRCGGGRASFRLARRGDGYEVESREGCPVELVG